MKPACWRVVEWRLRHLSASAATEAAGDLLEDYARDRRASGRWRAEWNLLVESRSVARAFLTEARSVRRQGARAIFTQRVAAAVTATATDLRAAVRGLSRRKGYALILMGVVAVGITLATSVVAIVDGALFKPLPYAQADRLVAIATGHSALARPPAFRSVSPLEVETWREAVPDVHFSAYDGGDRAIVGPDYDRVRSAHVDASFFDVLGASPWIGGFVADDFGPPGAVRPAIVTHGFFARRLGSDLAALGRLLLDEEGNGIRVVGVLPDGFVMPDASMPEVLTPLAPSDPTSRGRYLRILARLPDAMAPAELAARIAAAQHGLADGWPGPSSPNATELSRINSSPFDDIAALPIRIALTAGYRQTAWIVFTAAVFLMALSCLNVTGMAVARVRERWLELGVRRSLGARQSDLLRLMAAENGVLVLGGLVAGVVASQLLLGVTTRLMPPFLRLFKTPEIDARVVAMAAIAAALSLVVVTVASARAAWRASGVQSGGGGRVTSRVSAGVLAAQVAIGLVIAVGGALVATGLLRVWGEDVGLPVEGAALVRMSPPRGASAAANEALLATIRALPGVSGAGGVNRALLQYALNGSVFDPPDGVSLDAESLPVTTGFFEAAELRPISGRLPTADELRTGAPVVVVSERVAREFWPGETAVGRSLRYRDQPFTVVGVVPDIRQLALDVDPRGVVYWPAAAEPSPGFTNVLLRFDARVAALPDIVAGIKARCPDCNVREGQTMAEAMDATIWSRRFNAWLFVSFGVAAVAIVGAGVLGLVAMSTAMRAREVGIRMALGSTPGGVVRQILLEQTTFLVAGLVVGGLVAAMLVRFVETFLYEMTVYDPSSWFAAVAVLVLVTLAGSLVPAMRASRVDPVRVLRSGSGLD